MPGGDRTGPWGAGPRTGRGAGYCRGFGMPGYANFYGGGFGRGRGFGYGFGRGGGRGWRNRFYATGVPGGAWNTGYLPGDYGAPYYAPEVSRSSTASEIDSLKEQAEYFKAALDDINHRLEQLQSPKNE